MRDSVRRRKNGSDKSVTWKLVHREKRLFTRRAMRAAAHAALMRKGREMKKQETLLPVKYQKIRYAPKIREQSPEVRDRRRKSWVNYVLRRLTRGGMPRFIPSWWKDPVDREYILGIAFG